MKAAKLNILFLGDILLYGISATGHRAGIFFTAINILHQFLKRNDVKVTILISHSNFHLHMHNIPVLKKYLAAEFGHARIDIVDLVPDNLLSQTYLTAYKKQLFCISQHFFLRKIFWTFIKSFIKPFFKFATGRRVKNFVKVELNKFDIFFSPDGAAPIPCETITKFTVLYDVIPLILPEYYGTSISLNALLSDIKFNEYFFADSNSTKQDFIRFCQQIDPEKITVTLLACNEHFVKANNNDIQHTKKKYNIPDDKKYIFSLCTLDPRKNLIRAVKTFIQFIEKNDIDDLVFVLGGWNLNNFILRLKSEIDEFAAFQDKIIFTGYVDDRDVPILYSGAEWFVYTSQYEGFGLPPLEAMS